MAINPINVSRVSQNMRTDFAIGAMQQNQLELFTTQSRIATGRSFLTPSEDPVAATRALDLTQALQRQDQFTSNLRHGDNVLAAADDAITEVNSLLIEAQTIASKNVSNLIQILACFAVTDKFLYDTASFPVGKIKRHHFQNPVMFFSLVTVINVDCENEWFRGEVVCAAATQNKKDRDEY